MEGKKETTHQPRHSWEDNIKMNFRRNRLSWYGFRSAN